MKNILTIQRSQSIHHTHNMVGSWTDLNLINLGKEQAHKIGMNLSKEIDGKKYILYSSDLLRTGNTAEVVG